MQKLRDALHRALHDDSTPSWQITSQLIAVLIAISIVMVVLEALDLPANVMRGLVIADRALLGVFAVEYLLRLLSWRPAAAQVLDLSKSERRRLAVVGRIQWALQPLNLFDLITIAALVPALRGLRVLRVLRLLRSNFGKRFGAPFAQVGAAFRENRRLYYVAFGVLFVETILGGITLTLVEGRQNPALETMQDGLWWALVTLTTVGFGDITPVTALGRSIGALLMISGMFTLALFAGIVSQTLLNVVLSWRQESHSMSETANHVVICGYGPRVRPLIDFVLEDKALTNADKMVIAPMPRPVGLPPEIEWVEGDATRDDDLAKTAIALARTAIVVAADDSSPEASDARTLLTLFTIRAQVAKVRRKEPLSIAAEILSHENILHAKSAGANEVIESTRMGLRLLARSASEPGTANVLSKVIATEASNLFTAKVDVGPESTFAEVVTRYLNSHDVLVLGWRDESGEHLNPPAKQSLAGSTELIYLADSPTLA